MERLEQNLMVMESAKKCLLLGISFLSIIYSQRILVAWLIGEGGFRLVKLNSIASYSSTKTTKTTTKSTNATVPDRLAVERLWQQYKLEHSDLALKHEVENGIETDRKFAVAYYSCPLQAGNRLHHFMNSLIWAVVTNRTLLWSYYDRETCTTIGSRYNRKICLTANTAEECGKILERKSWLPSLEYWKNRLNLTVVKRLSFWTTHKAVKSHKYWFKGAENDAGLADSTQAKLVDFPQMLGQDAWDLHKPAIRNNLLTFNETRDRADTLMKAGADFLYGMVFFESFSFQPRVSTPLLFDQNISIESNTESVRGNQDGNISVVIHARHSKVTDDGSNVKREITCLDRAMNGTSGYCQVLLLSDRDATLRVLREYIHRKYPQCHALVAPHDNGASFSVEHGPFAGSGFFQDLSMVSNQTFHMKTRINVFIGTKRRSSSQLIRELMTYQLSRQERFQDFSLPVVDKCNVDDT